MALDQALKEKPGDPTLNRLFLDHGVYQKREVRERYLREFEAHPGSLDFAYLYARSLVGSNTPEALKIYAQILAKDPEYPWVHLSQLEIYRAEAFRDRQKLQSSFAALRSVCPSETGPWQYLSEIEDSGFVASQAAQLREFLDASAEPRNARLYPYLWAAEFRIRPREEHDAERQLVAKDLDRLRSFDTTPDVQLAIAKGARLTGNDALAKEIEAKRPADWAQQYREWLKQHRYPLPDDPPDKKRAYAQAQLEAAAKWIAQWPGEPFGYLMRVQALVTLEAPVAGLQRAGDDLLAADRQRDFRPHSNFLSVARAYLQRGVLLDRVPAIIDEAVKSFDDPEAIIEIDLAPSAERTASNRMLLVTHHAEAIALLSECYEKQGQVGKAQGVLRPLEDYLAAKAPSKDEKNQDVLRQYGRAQFSLWFRVATLADHQGRKLDALQAYHEASALAPVPSETVLAPQQRLWKELGGSDEAWARWINATPNPSWPQAPPSRAGFTPVNRPLPEFSVRDIAGATWTPARLKGKTTIAVAWATWCAPCREELPHFAKLAERLKDHADVQVISLNMDEDIGEVEPFLKQKGYVFPVLLARQLAQDLMTYVAIPRTWIFRDGVLAAEQVGYGGDGARWVEDVMAQLKN